MRKFRVNKIYRFIKDEKGIALPTALVLLVLGGLLIIPILSLAETNFKTDIVMEQANKRIYTADAGIQWALWNFKYNTAYTKGEPLYFTDPNFIGETVTITVLNEGSTNYRITSNATATDGTWATIVAYISNTSDAPSVFDYALASLGGNINLSNNAQVRSDTGTNGDVYSSANLTLANNVIVYGDGSANGNITTINNSDIRGAETTGVPKLTTPDLSETINGFKNEAMGAQCLSSYTRAGSLTIGSNTNFPNQEYIQQNLTINNNAVVNFTNSAGVCVGYQYPGNLNINTNAVVTFNGPVKVFGSINIDNNSIVTFNGPVYVAGSFTSLNNAQQTFKDVVYVHGNMTIAGNCSRDGADIVVDGNITVGGNTVLAGGGTEIPYIISTGGNVTFEGNTIGTSWAKIFVPVGTFTGQNNAQIKGSVAAWSINLLNNAIATYPMALKQGQGGGGSGLGQASLASYAIQ